MKLTSLLSQHAENNDSATLTKNFGDGFLCKNNSVYRNVRRLATDKGFHFTTQMSADHAALPLAQLDAVLEKKIIPYFDNVTMLVKIDHQKSHLFLWDEVVDQVKKNNLFHESAHAIIHSDLWALDLRNESALKKDQHQVFKMLVEESFANTCELLSTQDVHNATHRIFHELNSYICVFEERYRLNQLREMSSPTFLFKFTFLSYLCSNYLHEQLSEAEIEVLFSLSERHETLTGLKKIALDQRKNFRGLFKIATALNPRFREITTKFHLKLQGVQTPFEQVLNFDFFSILENDKRILDLIHQLSEKIFVEKI